jgi:hypothetical protein
VLFGLINTINAYNNNDVILFYDFQDFNDRTGLHNLTQNGGSLVTAINGTGYQLNGGVGQSSYTPDSNDLDLNKDWSICYYQKLNSLLTSARMVHKLSSTPAYVYSTLGYANYQMFWYDTTFRSIDSGTGLNTGSFEFVCFTRDTLGHTRIYRNSSLLYTESTFTGNIVNGNLPLHIGGDGNNVAMDGIIDQVSFFSKALNLSEITQLESDLGNPLALDIPTLSFNNITANNVTLINNTFYNDSIQFQTFVSNTSTNANVNHSYSLTSNNNFTIISSQTTISNITTFVNNDLNSKNEFCIQNTGSNYISHSTNINSVSTASWNGSNWIDGFGQGVIGYMVCGGTVQYATNTLNGSVNLNLSEGNYNISFYAENNETNITSSNFSFLVDRTPPNIQLLDDLNSDDYSVNFSEVVNVTDNLSGLASCTINITYLSDVQPDSNFFINCTDSQFFTRAGFYNGFLETIDNAGNKNTLNANGTINPVRFIFFNQTNGSEVSNYSATVTNPLGIISQTLVDINNPINLTPIINGSLILGNYSIKFEKFGFETESFIVLMNETNAGANVSFIVSPVTLSIQVFDSINVNQQLFFNITISNGSNNQVFLNQFDFSKNFSETITGDISLIIESVGYSQGFFFNTLNPNTSVDIDAFLTNTGNSSTIRFFVADSAQASVGLEGVLIELQKLINGSFVTIQQALTGATGESFIQTDVSQSYLIVFSKDGFVSATAQTIPNVLEYSVSLSSTAEVFTYVDDISFLFTPTLTVLDSNTSYNFTGFISGTGFTSITYNVYNQNNTLLFSDINTNPTGTTFINELFVNSSTTLIKVEMVYIIDGVTKVIFQNYEIFEVTGFIENSQTFAQDNSFSARFIRFLVIMFLTIASLTLSRVENLEEVSLFVIPVFGFLAYINFMVWTQVAALSVLAIVFYIGGKR